MLIAERFVLTLSLALAGCHLARVPEGQQATNDPARARAETSDKNKSRSQPLTPRSVLQELFPNAPAKTQTAECFRSLTPETSMFVVVQKCGRPDEEIGSGVYIFIYHLSDGSTVSIGTSDLNRIDHVNQIDRSGNSSSFLRRK